MVAYSFRPRFVRPIEVGLGIIKDQFVYPKTHTVRAIGRKRHARTGEKVQLYTGLRTKAAKKIGEATCNRTAPIVLEFGDLGVWITIDGKRLSKDQTHDFAHSDGFRTLDEFMMFWADNHDCPTKWSGIIIYWEAQNANAAAELQGRRKIGGAKARNTNAP